MMNKKSIDDYYAVWKDLTENPPLPLSAEEVTVARERHYNLLQALLHTELRNPKRTRSFAELQQSIAIIYTPKFVRCLEITNPNAKDHFDQIILTWQRETNSGQGIHIMPSPAPQNVYPLHKTEKN